MTEQESENTGPKKKMALRPRGHALRKRAEKGYVSQMKVSRRVLILVAIVLGISALIGFQNLSEFRKTHETRSDLFEVVRDTASPEQRSSEQFKQEEFRIDVESVVLKGLKFVNYLTCAMAILFLNLFFMAKSRPALACKIGLWTYLASAALAFLLNPTSLLSPFSWLKVVFISVSLYRGMKAASSFERLKDQAQA